MPFGGGFELSQAMNIFRGLTGHYDLKPDSTKTFDLTNRYNLPIDSYGDYSRSNVIGQIMKQMGASFKSREDLIKNLMTVRDNELVQTLLTSLYNDAFSSVSDDKFISIEYSPNREKRYKTDEDIQKIMDGFVDQHDLAGLSSDILPDFMLMGEYFLKTKIVKGVGVVEITDNCDLDDYLAIYKGRDIDSFFRFNRKASKFELIDKDEIVHFCLNNNRLRVKVETDTDIIDVPESVRVGTSVIYPVLSSVKKLSVLETTALASELKRVLAPIIVSVDMNADMDNTNTSEAIDRYENILNSMNTEALNMENLNVGDILQTASRFKVIPRFSDGKGGIEQIQFNFDSSDLNNRINDVRKNIALAMGVPSFYLAYGDQLLGKTDMLKVYSAYSTKLVNIQTCYGNGIKDIMWKHLFHKGYYVEKNDIKVKFKSVTNVDLMDDMEVIVAVMTTLKDFVALLNEISSSDQIALEVDSKELLEFFKMYTAAFPKMQKVLKLYADGKGRVSLPDRGGELMTPSGTPSRGNTSFQGPQLSTQSPQGAPSTSSTPTGETPTITAEAPTPPETPSGGSVNVADTF